MEINGYKLLSLFDNKYPHFLEYRKLICTFCCVGMKDYTFSMVHLLW